jgi:ABC-type Na+ efflux pump permease subunit
MDLRVELQLLADHFTLAAVGAAVRSHLLAVAVLLLMPSMLRHYRNKQA